MKQLLKILDILKTNATRSRSFRPNKSQAIKKVKLSTGLITTTKLIRGIHLIDVEIVYPNNS